MKVISKNSFVFVFLILMVSCATASGPLPEKYKLGNELEEVDQITTFREPDWEEVDDQSIILRVDLNDFYLLVLRRPINTNLPIAIGISGSLSSITAGFDQVVVIESGIAEYYTIEKIYRLKGREKAEEIKKRFGKK